MVQKQANCAPKKRKKKSRNMPKKNKNKIKRKTKCWHNSKELCFLSANKGREGCSGKQKWGRQKPKQEVSLKYPHIQNLRNTIFRVNKLGWMTYYHTSFYSFTGEKKKTNGKGERNTTWLFKTVFAFMSYVGRAKPTKQ